MKVKTFRHDSPMTTQKVLEEDPKVSSTLPWQCQSNTKEMIPSTMTYAPSIGGISPHLYVGSHPPNNDSLSQTTDVQDGAVIVPTIRCCLPC